MTKLKIPNLDATKHFSELLAACVDKNLVVAVSGNLGSGKTTFVKYLAQALGVLEVVTSPTFTMMNEYHSGRIPLYHIDLYRVGESMDRGEVISLDQFVLEFEEILEGSGLIVIEWPKYFIVEGENYLDNISRLDIKIKTPRINEPNNELNSERSFQLEEKGEEPKMVLDKVILSLSEKDEISVLST